MRKTRTSQIETAIADIFTIVDGHDGIDSDTIMEAMMDKGHDGTIVNDTINTLETTGALAWVSGLWYLNDDEGQTINKTKKEKGEVTMKTETTENKKLTIEQIIENLESGKKEETLKKAKKDFGADSWEVDSFKTKQQFIDHLKMVKKMKDGATKKPVKKQEKTIVVTAGLDPAIDMTETTKTPYQQKQDNVIVSMIAIRDGIRAAINTLDNNTLKETKSNVLALLNTEARKHLNNEFVAVITKANDCRIKKDYKSELRIALKELNSLIDREYDNQDKEPIEIPVSEKVKVLTPDTAMLISQLDLKEKSRFDTLFDMIQKQDKKIDSLTKMVQCHKDTISLLLARLNTGKGNVSGNDQKSVKQDKKPVKTDEEIQIENRQAYIKGLKGIDKAVFDILTSQKRLTEENFIVMESLEDYTPKMIKVSIAAMVSSGLFDKTKQKNTFIYTIAPVSSFKGEKPESNKANKANSKDTGKKTFTRGKSKNKVSRYDAVLMAIASYDKGETFSIKDIAEEQNTIYAANGGKLSENPVQFCGNVTRKGIKNALKNGTVKDNGNKTYTVK
jgi:hypothetical protein